MLIYGEGWGNLSECRLTNNQIGLHFNSTGQSVSDQDFENNRFEGNATAILLENVPTDVTMDFPARCLPATTSILTTAAISLWISRELLSTPEYGQRRRMIRPALF